MKKLVLTQAESDYLKQHGAVEICRNGFDILVEYSELDEDYHIYIINPYDKLVIKD